MHKKYKGQTAVLVFASITAAVFLACTQKEQAPAADALQDFMQDMEPEPEESFRVEIIDDGNAVEIAKYLGTNTRVQIPSTIQGLPVTVIGGSAFHDKGLEAVIIPEGVTKIGGCYVCGDGRYLSEGSYAFGENRLSYVALPNSLTLIGDYAFYGNCLTFVDIPDSVTNIGEGAFAKNLLTDIIIPAGVSSLLTGTFTENMISNVVIPKNFRYMEAGVFDRSVTLEFEPDGIFSMFDDFIVCKYLRRIDGNAVEVAAIFKYLGTDDDVVIPEKIWDLPVTAIEDEAFFAGYWNESDKTFVQIGHQISSIVIPESVTGIGENAFMGNRLTALKIPDSVDFIGTGAFAENMLASVSLPEGGNLRWIESHAFRGNQLTGVVIPRNVVKINASAFLDNKLTDVVIPDSVTQIMFRAFAQNQIPSVVIPKSVTFISDQAFALNLLTKVVVPNSEAYVSGNAFDDNVTVIKGEE